MKKLILAVVLVVGMTAFAQEGRRERMEKLTPEQRVDLQVKKMTKDLDLNDKQALEVRILVQKEVEKREAKRAEREAKRAAMRPSKEEMENMKAKMQEEQKANAIEMKKILTADQYAKWEKNREERKEKMMDKMQDRKENRKKKADKE